MSEAKGVELEAELVAAIQEITGKCKHIFVDPGNKYAVGDRIASIARQAANAIVARDQEIERLRNNQAANLEIKQNLMNQIQAKNLLIATIAMASSEMVDAMETTGEMNAPAVIPARVFEKFVATISGLSQKASGEVLEPKL